MKTVIYARVSTGKEEQKQDTENQIHPLKEFISRNPTWILTQTYVDYVSGKEGKTRPQLEQLLSDARHMKFQCVVVWKLDRFARSMADFIRMIQELDKLGIRFISITQGIDSDQQSAGGRLLMHIVAAMAEFERHLIVERIKASIERRKAQGLPPGRAKVVVDIAKIGQLYDSGGMTIRDIAERFQLSRGTVANRLKEWEGLRATLQREDIIDVWDEVVGEYDG